VRKDIKEISFCYLPEPFWTGTYSIHDEVPFEPHLIHLYGYYADGLLTVDFPGEVFKDWPSASISILKDAAQLGATIEIEPTGREPPPVLAFLTAVKKNLGMDEIKVKGPLCEGMFKRDICLTITGESSLAIRE